MPTICWILTNKCFRPCNPNPVKMENMTVTQGISQSCTAPAHLPLRANHYSGTFPLEFKFCLSSCRIAEYVLFCVKFVSLNIIVLRFIHGVLSISTLSLLSWVVVHYINIPQFVDTFLLMDTWALASFWLL